MSCEQQLWSRGLRWRQQSQPTVAHLAFLLDDAKQTTLEVNDQLFDAFVRKPSLLADSSR
jgi:hypothetical protein